MTRIEAVLFDWGDTLFESPHAPTVIRLYAKERGVALDEGAAQAMWDELWDAGKTREEHAKGRDLSPEAHRRVWTELFARKQAILPGIGPVLYERVMQPTIWKSYPDTEPTLRALKKRRVKIGIVSNHAWDLRPILGAAGLGDLVDIYAISYEVGVAKPSPVIFAEANTLMVGDDAVSDAAAADAGLQLYLLGPYRHGSERGLARVVQIVEASRAAERA